MVRQTKYILSAVLFLLMTGCTLEQKLAKTFVKTEFHDDFYILKPDFIFKYNLKEFEIEGFDTLPGTFRDSLLMEKSLFLKSVVDSTIIEEYTAGLRSGFKKFGAGVLHEDAVDTLMDNGGTSYILNIAQFSLEEYIHPYSTEEWVYDEIIVIDGIDMNAINYNIWLELGRMNSEEKNQVLFVSDYFHDSMDGTLKQNLITGKMSFDYTIDTISIAQIYDFARRFGEKTAGYLYDYLLNAYIGENIPEDYPYERIYYHYDPNRRLLYPVEEDQRIIEIEGP
jgi:hypothetical protein